MATTFVLEAAISEAGSSEAVIGGGFPGDESDREAACPVRLFVLQRATDTLPRSIDLDRYGCGVRHC